MHITVNRHNSHNHITSAANTSLRREICLDCNNNGSVNTKLSGPPDAFTNRTQNNECQPPSLSKVEIGRFKDRSAAKMQPQNQRTRDYLLENIEKLKTKINEQSLASISKPTPSGNMLTQYRRDWVGAVIGVFTSGGDSQGMNAALRSIVRTGMYLGCKVFYIKEGYQGMVDGGDNIVEATWGSTSNMINVGGTIIGSARCLDVRERRGRLKAAKNLVKWGITNLICIGGDGSLTGANVFRQEWPSLLKELADTNQIDAKLAATSSHLNICGLVGSIDNDFCGTDFTIGVDSALQRILEAVDDIMTTAVSHKRAFVLEVMGRACGFLPLVAGIACEASAIFIPEDPPGGDWRQRLCDDINLKISSGEERRTHIVMVAEGAMDRKGNPIKAAEVKDVLQQRLNLDTRVTVLGHVQRGGCTSVADRMLGTEQGAAAVMTLREATPTSPAYVIAISGHSIIKVPLLKAVEMTSRVEKEWQAGMFDNVISLRGRLTLAYMMVYLSTQHVTTHHRLLNGTKRVHRVAVVCVGHPTCGMNSCARGVVSVCVSRGFLPVLVHDGWEGLLHDNLKTADWNLVQHWTKFGGSNIGARETTAGKIGINEIARKLSQHNISGLILIGGFEAFQSACDILEGRRTYTELCIPVTVVPATISNNVPGCEISIGADSALNQICLACDDLKHSAYSVQTCVYVVEVGGDNCGYLATVAAIASGADASYIKEEAFSVRDIKEMANFYKEKFKVSHVKQGLIIINENASKNITTDVVYRILSEEGKHDFITRKVVLQYTQEGATASAMDRYRGTLAGCKAARIVIDTIEELLEKGPTVYTKCPSTVTLTTTTARFQRGKRLIHELIPFTDFYNRIPRMQWWMTRRPLLKILATVDAKLTEDMELNEAAMPSDLNIQDYANVIA